MDETEYRHLDAVTEYDCSWYTGGYDTVEQPDGTVKEYYWADVPDAVTIVAIDDDDVIMVEEYRPVPKQTYVSCPTGIIEDGESYEAAASRELTEETGYKAATVNHIQTLDVATGVLRHKRGVVVATDLEYGEPNRDENEFLTVRRVPKDGVVSLIRDAPSNSAAIEAIFLAKEEGYL